MLQCRCLRARCRRLRRYRSHGRNLPPALLRRGARRVVLRRARPGVVPLAPDVSASRNSVDIEVRKGPQHPAARVLGCWRRA
jgi:hypothetical protein